MMPTQSNSWSPGSRDPLLGSSKALESDSFRGAWTCGVRMVGVLGCCFMTLVGCKVEEAQGVKVVTTNSPPPPGPRPEKGIVIQDESDAQHKDMVDDEESLEALAQRQKSKKTVFVKPGETIQLFSDWSSIVPEDLMALNDGKPFRYGQKWAMSLTAAEYDEFERKRKEHWDKKKNDFYAKYDIKLVEYSVKRSDTMESIARKNKVDLWFLAIHNPSIDPYKLSMGTEVFIPVLMNRKKAPEDAPPADGDGAGGSAEDSKKGKASKKDGKAAKEGSERPTAGDGAAEDGVPVVVKKGESLNLYTKWGGFTMEDLERLNPGLSNRMLREGDTVRLPLTAEQMDEFQKKRGKGKRAKPTLTPPGDLPPKDAKETKEP